jgi:hypothetical protein
MYARLWWKDARQFWPIWVFLALAAAVVQGLLLYFGGRDARQGALGFSALICASLYAFAVGAAAFAGEREMGTLRLLDILPVDRWVVWASKVSFAVVTTLALALVLLAAAALNTERWNGRELDFGMMVLVALGWGLFWSAILSNALTAAVTAICCSGLGLVLLTATLDELYRGRYRPFVLVLGELCAILVTTIASELIFVGALRLKKLQFEFRSPIVMTRAHATSARRLPIPIQSPVATVLAPVPRPVLGASESSATYQPPRRAWLLEARALARQTVKEGWRSWCLVAAIGLVYIAFALQIQGYLDNSVIWLTSIGVGLVAGASVFGLENRARTYRFLAHHGARPGLVWLVKMTVWCSGLALVWGPHLMLAARARNYPRGPIENWLVGVLTPLLFFAVAQLCGMTIRRGITAVVVALVLGLALAMPLVALVVGHMLPVQGLLVLPAGLLAVTWAWSGDWLIDRPAPGRWVRLGLLITSTFALVVSCYAGYRAWSIPDVGPIAPPAAWLEAAASTLPAERNAAELYREAGRRLVGPTDSPEFLNRNREVLDLVRHAAARADCRFDQMDRYTLIDQPDLPPMVQFVRLMTRDVEDRQKRGDLAGAWDEIFVLFRMARHFSEGAGMAPALAGAFAERSALGQAMEWAVARGQTLERLGPALAAFRALPKMRPAGDVVRAEAILFENTLDLSTSKLRDLLYQSRNGWHQQVTERTMDSLLFDVLTTPWERARARRVNRLVSLAVIREAALEPWQRPRHIDSTVSYAEKTTLLAAMFIPNTASYVAHDDLDEVGRRALLQVFAIRIWQLRHGGKFPDRLDSLVPDELPSLPDDPYSGRPFGYIRSSGQAVAPLSSALVAAPGNVQAASKGSWLLYSVGADDQDDDGTTFPEHDHRSQLRPRNQPMDIMFAIPPVDGIGGARKE